MNKNLKLWLNRNEITVNDIPQENVIKFTSFHDNLYILTNKHNLFYGKVECLNDVHSFINFKNSSNSYIDIDSSSEYLYLIDTEGNGYKTDEDLNIIENIILLCQESEACSHDLIRKYKLKIKSISVNDFGGLLIANNDQLWAFGDMPQINISSPVPKLVDFFSTRKVFTANVGKDFAVIIISSRDNDKKGEVRDNCLIIEECLQCISLDQYFLKSEEENQSSGSSSCLIDKKTLECFELFENNNINRNVIFQNTEAAKDFLMKQFSWISKNCENYMNSELKNNENITFSSLVYDKVKSVSDKVINLSKNLSSDAEDIQDNADASIDCLSTVTSVEDISCLRSHTASETVSENESTENYSFLLKNGADIVNREVWTWGNIKHGQLGLGDNMKRERPMIITKLSNSGAIKCSIESYHTAVLTLDGRSFLWGKNDQNQVTFENNFDQSSPKVFLTPENQRILDVSCGFYHTNLLTTNCDLYHLGSIENGENKNNPAIIYSETASNNSVTDNLINCDEIELNPLNDKNKSNGKVFCSNNYTLLDVGYIKTNLNNIIIEESCYLEDLLIIYFYFVKFVKKKTEEDIYEKLSIVHLELIYLVANNLSSIIKSSYGSELNSETIIIKYYEYFCLIYKNYFDVINDVVSIDGFEFLKNIIDLPQIIYKTRLLNSLHNYNKIDLIQILLKYPKDRFLFYEEVIHKILGKENDRLRSKILNKFASIYEEANENEVKAEKTKDFWKQSGKLLEYLKKPHRKLVIESRKNVIYLQGSSRFSSHWFILLSDIFVYINGSVIHTFDLKNVWVEVGQEETETEHKIVIKTPEENFVLVARELEDKSKWLHAFQNAIKVALNKEFSVQVPNARNAEYFFVKLGFFKNARYVGRWSNGKMQGRGNLEWADGRKYFGQIDNNVIAGFGKMEMPNKGIYEGSWKNNKQNGYGIFKYVNGDIYKGYFKDGLPHGHGCLQQGHFMSSTASVYVGEWTNGMKNGYGILDNVATGEKYLGNWHDNKKHGNGIVVTADGVYYEGLFNQDVFTGNGLMILEDGTHYEGDFKGIGQFNGKGRLTLNSGHSIVGQLSGSLSDGLKINNGTLSIIKSTQNDPISVPKTFGKYCVSQEAKWVALFRHCYQNLGLTDVNIKNVDTQKIWHNVAVRLSHSYRNGAKNKEDKRKIHSLNNLDFIPQFGMKEIDYNGFNDIKKYLVKAFENCHHPLYSLLNDLTTAYSTSYGGLRAHPLLLRHAVQELHSVLKRIYEIIILMFPALPPYKGQLFLGDDDSEVASYQTLLHPIILPKVHSSLFTLYTLHNNLQDVQYWRRLIEWNKQPDYSLMVFLSVDKRFFGLQDTDSLLNTSCKDVTFLEAIETLQLIKTMFSPFEKVLIIRETFQKATDIVQSLLGNNYKWNMDDLFPVFMYIVVRARILQLGSEIHFIEDFIELNLENGELGIMFTTLKACYQQILQEKATIN